ncbi:MULTISPECIES: glucose/sorbosone family PQQ-dependent dehydrogenase [Sorangium]|uniref:glucose/sorbosone family PQQ-dependent dehydrogenase n=1 Tax=Sorangium TaxID=39643 RepID=UPI001F3D9D34|nr:MULTISPECIES: glucose/sorbosone family PQQ-dependent dehydrogenase [Sorangium]
MLSAASWSLVGCGSEDPLDGPVEAHGDGTAESEPVVEARAGLDAGFTSREILRGLSYPMRIVWGPDGYLWLTERVGKRVVRVRPSDGQKTTAVTITEAYQSGGQDGVLGLALHPDLLQGTGNDYVYVSYTYDADPGSAVNRRAKIRRYTYNLTTKTLGSPVDIITGLPGSDDHNSARLLFGPDQKLYYTVGDQGNNQFNRKCLPVGAQDLPTATEVAAQNWSKYTGKILRLDLDGSIPGDNPQIAGVRSHVYSYGHRNPQGLTFLGGKLYANEHGPKSDDELNLIQPGKNYGWPHVAGYQDSQAYTYDNWSASSPTPCSSLAWNDYTPPSSVPRQQESAWSHPDFTPPLVTFYTVPNGYNFKDPACGGNDYICWPTIAPSSLHTYAAETGIPEWEGSLLMTTLKKGAVYRVSLGPAGDSVVGEPVVHFQTTNRYRDLALSPDGLTVYVITDSQGSTSGPTGGATSALSNPGAILEFKYTGTN